MYQSSPFVLMRFHHHIHQLVAMGLPVFMGILFMLHPCDTIAQTTAPSHWHQAAQWRWDRLWPDDPWNPNAYIPMVFKDGRWEGSDRMFEGLPHGIVDEKSIILGAGASRFGAEYHRAPVLAFRITESGIYGLTGLAMGVERTGPMELIIARRTADKVEPIVRRGIQPGITIKLDGIAVEMVAGDELVIIAWVRLANTKAFVRLVDLRVSTDSADQTFLERRRELDAMPRKALIAAPNAQAMSAANQAVVDAGEQGVLFPADSGVVNVRAFGAVGDGVHDDTQALRRAYRHTGLVYIPNGTYLVTGMIEPPTKPGRVPSRRILQGQSRDKTIIRLVDNAPGFDRGDQPFPVLITSWGAAQAFRNAVRDLTIDVGSGNPGAVALDFFANNQGAIQNVRLISSDPQRIGAVGLRIDGHAGPLLVSDLEVIGFETGIHSNPDESATFENIKLREQRQVGFNITERSFVRRLASQNSVPAVRARGSLLVLMDAILDGSASAGAAIEMNGQGLLRDIQVTGYPISLQTSTLSLRDAQITEWTSKEPVALESPVRLTMRLPIEETPTIPWGDLSGWTSIARYAPQKITITHEGKPRQVTDWTPAMQAAIDSGAHTVYFPVHQKIDIYGTVILRGKVQRLIGLECLLEPGPLKSLHRDWTEPRPRLVLEDGESPVVIIERFDSIYGNLVLEHKSSRYLVVRNMTCERIGSHPGAGDLFLDDTIPGYVTMQGGRLFARQMNVEVGFNDKFLPRERFATQIFNNSKAWIFGLKTEQSRGKILVTGGSRAEVYAYIYSHTSDNPFPMFQVESADMTVTVMEILLRNAPHVAVLRRITPQGPVDYVRPNTTIPLLTCVRQ